MTAVYVRGKPQNILSGVRFSSFQTHRNSVCMSRVVPDDRSATPVL